MAVDDSSLVLQPRRLRHGNESNYLAMLGRHGPGSAIPSPEDAAEAAHRARRIHERLRAMTPSDAGVLQCAYELATGRSCSGTSSDG